MTNLEILQQAINKIVDIDIGIYPAEVVDKKRTEWQEGWNAAHKKYVEKIYDVLKELNIDVFDDEDESYIEVNGKRL